MFSVYDQARGITDEAILLKALTERWIQVTNDKVYRERHAHHGVILIRLDDERSTNKIAVLKQLLERYADYIPDQFVVVTDNGIRFARLPSDDE